MEWSPAHPITRNANPAEHLEGKAGVYRVCATLGNGCRALIHRACGVDSDGVLYIGEGANLRDRIGRLSHIAQESPLPSHHDLIKNWLDFDLDRLANRAQLVVEWRECRDHKGEERSRLMQYKNSFGDLPPANLKLERQDG